MFFVVPVTFSDVFILNINAFLGIYSFDLIRILLNKLCKYMLILDSALAKAFICIEVFHAFYEDVSSERNLKTTLFNSCMPAGKLTPACMLI